MDHLLRLKPVEALKTEDAKLWELLNICVAGTLVDYQTFVKKHATFAKDTLKVDEAQMTKKMRMLTLIARCEHLSVSCSSGCVTILISCRR